MNGNEPHESVYCWIAVDMPGQNTNFLALRRHELIPVWPVGSFALISSIANGMMTFAPRRIILSVRLNNRNTELATLALCLYLAAILSWWCSSNKTDVHLVPLRRESHQVDHFWWVETRDCSQKSAATTVCLINESKVEHLRLELTLRSWYGIPFIPVASKA